MAVEKSQRSRALISFADGELKPIPNREKSYDSFAPSKTYIALTFALCTDEVYHQISMAIIVSGLTA